MPNLVDNPKLLTSTNGDLQVTDSLGNFPTVYSGGTGAAPDNYWFLGGPDYGTFLVAGGVWDTKQPPGGGKSILLDAGNPLVQQSGGITQVVPVNQVDIKPLRVTAAVAAAGCTGSPRIQVDCIGYPPGWPSAGGGYLVFDPGTYDFTTKKTTFIPSAPVKYLFLHLLHRGFSQGKAWYGDFSLEELELPVVSPSPDNVIINHNFFYTSDDVTPTAWKVTNAALTGEASPLGSSSMLIQKNGSVIQRNICLDLGKQQQKLTVYAASQGTTVFRVKITLLDRYRSRISEKVVNIQAKSQWKATGIAVLGTELAEKADVEVHHLEGSPGLLGGVLLVAQEFNPSKIIDIAPTRTTVKLPAVTADTTAVIDLGATVNPQHVELNTGHTNNTVYLTNGLMGGLVAAAVHQPLSLLTKAAMTWLSATEYNLDPWPDGITGIEVDGEELDQYLRIPHVVHPDNWQVTTGGSIPANDTRYYCVTALTAFGETDRSNEVRAVTDAVSNTNRVPIEITPVAGAAGYRIYMTQNEDTDQPWAYSAARVKKLVWEDGANHLVAEVTAEGLRDAGYIIYDTGTPLSPGFPPAANTAKRWVVDSDNQKVVFDATSAPAGEDQLVVAVYPDGKAGIYQSNVFTPGKATLTVAAANIVALSYFDDVPAAPLSEDPGEEPNENQSAVLYLPHASQLCLAGANPAEPEDPVEPPFTMPTEGMQMWLDAAAIGADDLDALASWPDLSGHGNSPYQNSSGSRPVFWTGILNGLPVVRFTGASPNLINNAGDTLSTIIRNAPGVSVFAVARYQPDGERTLLYISRNGSSTSPGIGVGTAGGKYRARGRRLGGDSLRSATSVQDIKDDYVVHSVIWNFQEGTIKQYINQQLDGSVDNMTTGNYEDLDSGYMRLGYTSGYPYFDNDMAEIVLYNRVVTEEEKAGIENLLIDKWGIDTVDEPEGVPLFTLVPTGLLYRAAGSGVWLEAVGTATEAAYMGRVVHTVELTGLQPDTEYEFVVHEDNEVVYLTWLQDPTTTMVVHWQTLTPTQPNYALPDAGGTVYKFITMPADLSGGSVKGALGGDISVYTPVTDQLFQAAANHDVRFFVWGGDLGYSDNDKPHRWHMLWEKWKNHCTDSAGRLIPIIPLIGNHEVAGSWNGTILDIANQHLGEAHMFYYQFAFPQLGYGALDFGNYLSIIVLDTEHTQPTIAAGTPQEVWLGNALAERVSQLHVVPVFHIPAYPGRTNAQWGIHGRIREHWISQFELYDNIQVAFQHHDHVYVRSIPIRNHQPDSNGIYYLGCGVMGVEPRDVYKPPETSLEERTTSEFMWWLDQVIGNYYWDQNGVPTDEKAHDVSPDEAYHIYIVEFTATNKTIQSVDKDGNVFHSFTLEV